MKTTRIFLLVLFFASIAISCNKKPDMYTTFQKLQDVNGGYIYATDAFSQQHSIMRLTIMADSLKNAGKNEQYAIVNNQLDFFNTVSMVFMKDTVPHPWPCPGGNLCTMVVKNLLIPGKNPKMFKNDSEIKLKRYNKLENIGLMDYKTVNPVEFTEKDKIKITYEIKNDQNEIIKIDIH
jgi:hypothetical protein